MLAKGSTNSRVVCVLAMMLMFSVVVGCASRVHVPKPGQSPAIVHCFDTVGHCAGAKPFLLGGTCCCTPSEGVLADWQKSGYFVDKSVEQVIAMYREQGIEMAIDHQYCNNACKKGPHVVKGGKCMVPPTPGTENFEEVLFGKVYLAKDKAPKEYRQSLTSQEIAYSSISPESKQSK